MEVIIEKRQLIAHKACGAYLTSPEWDAGREALVYSDWDASVARLSSTSEGLAQLGWLVVHGLVPMTRLEFTALKRATRLKENVNG